MFRSHRAGGGWLVLALASFLALLPSLRGEHCLLLQRDPPGMSAASPVGGPVTLPGDARARQKVEAARDYVKAQEWESAVRVLQDLLDGKEDQFLVKGDPPAESKAATYSGGLRAEANRLLAGLPPKGRETYNAVHGAKAKALLKEAVEKDDVQLLAQVVQRYLHTDAGADAAERLGTYHLDRGHRDLAGRWFAHLLSRPGAERLPALTLYKAAVACRLADDTAGEERAWKALAVRAPDGLTLGGEHHELDRLRADLARLPAEPPARGDGDVPLLEPTWTANTVLGKRSPEWVAAGVMAQERAHRLVLPGYYPIAVPGRVVYRSHSGVHALDPADGRELWKVPSSLGLDAVAGDSGRAVVVRNWLRGSYGDAYHFPLENSLLGRLSTDGVRVYAVEDVVVPPPPDGVLSVQAGAAVPGWLREAAPANRLRAIDLDTGAVAWELGGRGELHNAFFLGAPLPVGGRLYALVDKEGEIRLTCLDPASGAVAWAQRLCTAATRMALDPGRRLRGVQMTCAGGLLICPTDAGAVLAFDLLEHSLAWAYLYPSNKQPQAEGMGTVFNLSLFNSSWRESAPAVVGDRVVFTPADSDQIYCVSLRGGKSAWRATHQGDAYFAGVFRDRVLLVGPTGARALSLADGKDAWQCRAGVPSGQGAASGNVYYLPLKMANETGGPGVAAIDAANGKVLILARSRRGEVPGNLAFVRGQVVSQTATSLTAYPQLKARLKRAEELLAGDPRNPRGLIERGTLRLDQGDVPGALADLRAAVAAAGDVKPEAQTRLHEALKQAVQRDFAAGEKYLAEFEASCRAPVAAEQERRQANYLLVLARGREGQGRVADALAAYARLDALAGRALGVWNGPEVGWMPSGRAAPPGPQVWVHGQVAALLMNARPEERAAIDREVARQWQALPAGADPDQVGRFVALFGSAGLVGLEARLTYAERLAARHGRGRFLEAELHLLSLQRQREAPQVAARALEALARLLTEMGQTEDALYYYRQLAEEFARTPVRDGKTGADFLRELALDKRFLPLLDDPWAGRKYKLTEVRGLFPPRGQTIGMEPEGEAPPCLRRQRLAFDVGNGALKLFDRDRGAELWSQSISVGNLRPMLKTAPPQWWIPYRAEGHLAVVSLGHMAYGIDLLERRLLWARDLGDRPMPLVRQVVVGDDRWRIQVQYQDGIVQPLGRVAPVQPSAVCLTVRGKLAALDPLRGDLLWTTGGANRDAELFADDASVYLVEGRSQRWLTLRRAVSLRDGVVRQLSGFGTSPDTPLEPVGGNVLVLRGGRLVLYDPRGDENVWNLPYGPGTLVARSEVPHLTATVSRDGKVHVYDLRRRQELFKAEVDPDHLRGVHEVHLFRDRWHYYLMLNRDLRGRDALAGVPQPNVVGGLRTLPAHGALYAFRRDSGSLHWSTEVKAQQLLLERFDESPLLLFGAAVQRLAAGPVTATTPAPGPAFTVTSIDKHTGKVVWSPKDYTPITSVIHAVQINPAAGTVEMISRNWKMRHTVAE